MKYTKFLYDVCSKSDDDEYCMHHEFSSSAMALDELQVQQIFASISRYGNPFDLGRSSIRNLVTCSEVDSKLSAFLLKWMRLVRLHTMTLEHLDFLRNQLNSLTLFQRFTPDKNHYLVEKKLTLPNKQSSSWKKLITLTLGSMPYCLFKNGHLQKAKKSELRKTGPVCPSKFPTQAWL